MCAPLRSSPEDRGSGVITSYSIHYTKLYETKIRHWFFFHMMTVSSIKLNQLKRFAWIWMKVSIVMPLRLWVSLMPVPIPLSLQNSKHLHHRRNHSSKARITSYNVCYTKLLRGITPDKTVYAYCQVGAGRSTEIITALKLLGYKNVKAYSGSWDEWGNDMNLPIKR